MNIKLKFSIIILATLLIGAAIGFEISEISIKSRFTKMNEFREGPGFLNRFEGIIQPDDNQRPIIKSILSKYFTIIDSTSKLSMNTVAKLIDSMKVELKKHLKKEQIERLEREINIRRDGPQPPENPNLMDRNGPPPFNQGDRLLRPQGDNRPPMGNGPQGNPPGNFDPMRNNKPPDNNNPQGNKPPLQMEKK